MCDFCKVLVDAECTHDGSIKHIQKFEQWGWTTLERRVLDAERTDTNLTALQVKTACFIISPLLQSLRGSLFAVKSTEKWIQIVETRWHSCLQHLQVDYSMLCVCVSLFFRKKKSKLCQLTV